MKNRLFIAFLSLMVLMLLSNVTMAADDVLITVATNPTELAEAGLVEMNFAISNYTDYELHSVTISSNGAIYDLGQDELIIPANGSAYNIIIKVSVSNAQIGLPIEFLVSWTQGGEPMAKTVSTTIARIQDPEIALERTVETELAKEGDSVTINYILTNPTKFDMTDVMLLDEKLSDKPILPGDTLRAGSSITIPYTYTMGTEDVVSAPAISYAVFGKTKIFSAIQPVTIQLILPKLELHTEMGTPTAEGVQFSLELKNTGNQDIQDITILDDKQFFVNEEPFSLAEGDTEMLTYRIVPSMEEPVRNVRFIVTGKDALGDPYRLEDTASFSVYPYVDEAKIQTNLLAETIEPWSEKTLSLKVRLSVQNTSGVALTNVQISEQMLGIVKVIDSLQKGESSFEQELSIGAPRNLFFTMRGMDPAGVMRDLGNVSLQVAYVETTEEPDLTPAPDQIGTGLFRSVSAKLSNVLLILGGVMAVAFLTLIILSVAERRQMNRIERLREKEALEEAIWNDVPAQDMARRETQVQLARKRSSQMEVRQRHLEQAPPRRRLPAPKAEDECPARQMTNKRRRLNAQYDEQENHMLQPTKRATRSDEQRRYRDDDSRRKHEEYAEEVFHPSMPIEVNEAEQQKQDADVAQMHRARIERDSASATPAHQGANSSPSEEMYIDDSDDIKFDYQEQDDGAGDRPNPVQERALARPKAIYQPYQKNAIAPRKNAVRRVKKG